MADVAVVRTRQGVAFGENFGLARGYEGRVRKAKLCTADSGQHDHHNNEDAPNHLLPSKASLTLTSLAPEPYRILNISGDASMRPAHLTVPGFRPCHTANGPSSSGKKRSI